jgi:hypothetical protein
MDGVLTILQESRFLLVDDAGIAHLFLLGPHALAEADQLEPLLRRQARLRVRYTEPRSILGRVAHAVEALEPPWAGGD